MNEFIILTIWMAKSQTQLSNNNNTQTENDENNPKNDALILSDVLDVGLWIVDCESFNSRLAISKWITEDQRPKRNWTNVCCVIFINSIKIVGKANLQSLFAHIVLFPFSAIWENIIWKVLFEYKNNRKSPHGQVNAFSSPFRLNHWESCINRFRMKTFLAVVQRKS